MDNLNSHRKPGSNFNRGAGVAWLALAFGLLTLFSGGNVLFGADRVRELAGAYVTFVVWFNFFAGFFYVIAAIGMLLGRRWALGLSILIAASTALIAVAFSIRVMNGGSFELRTVGALTLRTFFWAGLSVFLFRRARKP